MKDPYVYEGTNILKNLANVKDQKKLDDYETTMVNLGIIKLLKETTNINKVIDIFTIHKIIFDNVYEWAGLPRKINILKEEPVLNGLSVDYCDYKNIENKLNKIQKDIDKINWYELNKSDMIKQTARFISSIWQVHAFREGNTRVIAIFLYYFLKNIGLKVNNDFISKHAKYFRSALVLASIGEYSEYNYLEEILMDSISYKVMCDKEEIKYQTIRGYNLEKYKYNYHLKKDE